MGIRKEMGGDEREKDKKKHNSYFINCYYSKPDNKYYPI